MRGEESCTLPLPVGRSSYGVPAHFVPLSLSLPPPLLLRVGQWGGGVGRRLLQCREWAVTLSLAAPLSSAVPSAARIYTSTYPASPLLALRPAFVKPNLEPGLDLAMASSSVATEAAQPQPPPSPRSPPTYPDICGRHRLQVGVQTLNREIGFLEEELHSLNDLQSASSCCKGVNDFVGTNPDPLLPINQKRHKCYVWRWLGAKLCIGFSGICCCGCSCKRKRSDCCRCKLPKNCCYSSLTENSSCCCGGGSKNSSCCSCTTLKLRSCCSCSKPRCWSCGKSSRQPRCCCCCDIFSSCKPCCILPSCSLPRYYCGCVCSCSDCTGSRLCARCCKPCCTSRCLCP